MAFPATYAINYYKGDLFEFKIYPKDATGAAFNLDGYDPVEGVKFTISTDRGAAGAEDAIEAFAQISTDKTYIACAILPVNSTTMISGNQYVYDVEISKAGPTETYTYTYTLLTGTITVTEQVTGA